MSRFPAMLFWSLPLLATPARLAALILGRVQNGFAPIACAELRLSGGKVWEVGGGGPKHFSRTTMGIPSPARGLRLLRLPMVPKGLLKLMFCGRGRIVATLLGDTGGRLEGWIGAEITGGPTGFFIRLCQRRVLKSVLVLRDTISCSEASLPTLLLMVTLPSSTTDSWPPPASSSFSGSPRSWTRSEQL